MDQKIKQQWITALRSGKYQQQHFSTNGLCALGVLASLADGTYLDVSKWIQGELFSAAPYEDDSYADDWDDWDE